ncbi:hypothetical protein R3P38DRAFT_2775098 [Favolaschia claudopus]|uniref:Uncharacterized protein n=1 Tax=Favolaschia claudopus TaxID=2862362 RepID=A0AAW0BTR5_9AGAR
MAEGPETFGIALQIPALTLENVLADAIRTGRRYSTRFVAIPNTSAAPAPIESSSALTQTIPSPSKDMLANTQPAVDRTPTSSATYDQWNMTVAHTTGVGAQVIGTLIFGDKRNPARRNSRHFPVAYDLGSNDTWVFDIKLESTSNPPTGSPHGDANPLFWVDFEGRTTTVDKGTLHSANYGDGSSVKFESRRDYVYFPPWNPPSQEPNKAWVLVTFGVATEITQAFEQFPASGIVGLGRRLRKKAPNKPMTLFEQVRKHLAAQEFTIMLSFSFGSGFEFTLHSSPFWFVDDEFAQDCYVKIKGARRREDPNAQPGYYVVPQKADNDPPWPTVELSIGGPMMALELWTLPEMAMTHVGTELYHFGAIQPKSLLFSSSRVSWTGPDVIGRVLLVSMEVVFQMPEDGPHTISWRTKPTKAAGPGPSSDPPMNVNFS